MQGLLFDGYLTDNAKLIYFNNALSILVRLFKGTIRMSKGKR